MAQMTPEHATAERIDFALDYVLRAWQDVPDLVAEWPTLDPIERTVIELEWAIPDSHLAELRAWAERGVLTPEQQARYEDVLAAVSCYRPALERLFGE